MELLQKDKVLAYINEMPAQFSAEEMIERIFILSKIERGQRDAEEGRVNSHEDVVAKFRQWQRR